MLEQLQLKPNVKRWVVAYSGGLDSSVLLHVLHQLIQQGSIPSPVCALHINHQLSPHANDWQQHCEQHCRSLGIPFYTELVDVKLAGHGVEAAARQARYRCFEGFLKEDDCLLLGHHADDQAETFLFRLMRGAGNLGLSSMVKARPLGVATLLRPLLGVLRYQLERYAVASHLQWIEDESNASLDFDRNFIRHKMIPVLESRWQQAKKQLANTADRLQKSQGLLNDLAEIDLKQLDLRQERCGTSIDWSLLRTFSQDRINNIIRFWCQCEGHPLPNSQQLMQIQQQFFARNVMLSSAVVRWGRHGVKEGGVKQGGVKQGGMRQCEVRQFNCRFYLMTRLADFSPTEYSVEWDVSQPLHLDEAGQLVLSLQDHVDNDCHQHCLSVAKLNKKKLQVHWRQGGERCTPSGRSRSQTVKKLLQEYKLETWLRDRVPLLFMDEKIVAVGDLWVCQGFCANINEPGYLLEWSL